MDIQELVRAQRAYFDTGATRPYAFRLLQLKKLQQALKDLGYNVSADGTYGPITVAAVTAIQKLNGLEDDGIAGAKTQTVLYSGNAKRYDSSSNS